MKLTKPENRQQNGIKGVIYGPSGIGKTTLIKTLPADETLVLDMESGLLAIDGHPVDSLPVTNWRQAKAIAAILAGADYSVRPGADYSAEHVKACLDQIAQDNPEFDADKYSTIFVDSITVASRFCKRFVEQSPDILTQQGKVNTLKMYGLLKDEMLGWLTRLQRIQGKNVWLVGILDKKMEGEEGATIWKPQMEGGATADGLIGIVDQVITMQEIQIKNGEDKPIKKRGFICQKINPWGYPAKDRSGTLNTIEPAHLGKLMEKIRTSPAHNPDFDYGEILDDEIAF